MARAAKKIEAPAEPAPDKEFDENEEALFETLYGKDDEDDEEELIDQDPEIEAPNGETSEAADESDEVSPFEDEDAASPFEDEDEERGRMVTAMKPMSFVSATVSTAPPPSKATLNLRGKS